MLEELIYTGEQNKKNPGIKRYVEIIFKINWKKYFFIEEQTITH
jgi:hypothetical protein